MKLAFKKHSCPNTDTAVYVNTHTRRNTGMHAHAHARRRIPASARSKTTRHYPPFSVIFVSLILPVLSRFHSGIYVTGDRTLQNLLHGAVWAVSFSVVRAVSRVWAAVSQRRRLSSSASYGDNDDMDTRSGD